MFPNISLANSLPFNCVSAFRPQNGTETEAGVC